MRSEVSAAIWHDSRTWRTVCGSGVKRKGEYRHKPVGVGDTGKGIKDHVCRDE